MAGESTTPEGLPETWVDQLAGWALLAMNSEVPDDVLHLAERSVADSYGCAVAALDDPAARAMFEVVRAMGGSPDCTLVGSELRLPASGAVLYNGALVRALDCNDIFFFKDPSGHPSDFIPVAWAVGEQEHASGREVLASIAIGYELFFRFLMYFRYHSHRSEYVWDQVPNVWDYTSSFAMVSAVVAGLLMKLDRDRLAQAISIAGLNAFTLRQVRAGEISMIKASAGALTSNTGVLAANMARAGMTGPREIFEGRCGMLAAYSIEKDHHFADEILLPIDDWKIRTISIKPFPSMGTSQGAICATLEIVHEFDVTAAQVQRIQIRLADLLGARRQTGNAVSNRPQTRETADHSLPFIVAMCIQDREFSSAQFDGEPWLRHETLELIDKVEQILDPSLNDYAEHGYPTVVTIETTDGRSYRKEMLAVPGSPDLPLSDDELRTKFVGLSKKSRPVDQLETMFDHLMALRTFDDAADVLSGLAG